MNTVKFNRKMSCHWECSVHSLRAHDDTCQTIDRHTASKKSSNQIPGWCDQSSSSSSSSTFSSSSYSPKGQAPRQMAAISDFILLFGFGFYDIIEAKLGPILLAICRVLYSFAIILLRKRGLAAQFQLYHCCQRPVLRSPSSSAVG